MSSGSEDDSLLNWQVFISKRKNITSIAKKQKSLDDIASCSNINKYAALDNSHDINIKNKEYSDVDENEDEAGATAAKPP